ncbi:pyrimidine reductase, riboflavin biosynthesis [Rhizobium sp. CF122]|uniref:dihydrofolate reductase family protein n=1 Tax=Rhizobium sp. CF122 TaxID=1144312 RepID=UPI000271861A|nr:RibD family protein [Rhizobium sp. CF122]EJL57164.1 pyrimidine reductase, riboflavin biosynthesis [Rhizobium sp. CF122]
MKPYVILHMGSSIDGRIVTSQWPKEMTAAFTAIYERLHQQMRGDAWIVGRVTMAEFAEGDPRPVEAGEVFPRTTWKAPGAGKGPYAIAVDQGARLHMNIDTIDGDPIVMILPETVPDNHLAELRRDGISYLFAGRHEIDLALALERIRADFGIDRLLLEGGGGINGSFLSAGLIDEISLLILPVADGSVNMPMTFDRAAVPVTSLQLVSVEQLQGDVVYLRYRPR